MVFASDNAPPALPVEIWGQATVDGSPAANDLVITAEVDGVNYAQGSPITFNNGLYNVMLVGGDRELTYLGDYDCSDRWNRNPPEACVQCSENQASEDYCIEGPQDDAKISIKINSITSMPFFSWLWGSSEEVDVITPIGDWDGAGCVDMADFGYFANHYGETPASSGWNIVYDLFGDDVVDMADFGYFANHYGEGCI